MSGRDADRDSGGDAPADRLDDVRAELERLDELPVEERPEVFARINEVLADELAALDDV